MKSLRGRPWLLALILLFMVAFPGFLRVEYINDKTNNLVECINTWADASVKRTTILTEANAKKTEYLDSLLRAASNQDTANLRIYLSSYVTASDEYNAALKENPIPESPRLACD